MDDDAGHEPNEERSPGVANTRHNVVGLGEYATGNGPVYNQRGDGKSAVEVAIIETTVDELGVLVGSGGCPGPVELLEARLQCLMMMRIWGDSIWGDGIWRRQNAMLCVRHVIYLPCAVGGLERS
jgi:hypothetical protein